MLSRRIFLITGSAAGAGLMLGIAGCARKTAPPTQDLNQWISIAPNGITTIRVNASDIGQGAQTGLAQIVADELDADWSKVRVEMAPVTRSRTTMPLAWPSIRTTSNISVRGNIFTLPRPILRLKAW